MEAPQLSQWNITKKKYNRFSLSRLCLSRITVYLEEKIWSLLRSSFSSFPQYFQFVSNLVVKLHIHFWNVVVQFIIKSANLICRVTYISNYFRESLRLRELESTVNLCDETRMRVGGKHLRHWPFGRKLGWHFFKPELIIISLRHWQQELKTPPLPLGPRMPTPPPRPIAFTTDHSKVIVSVLLFPAFSKKSERT